MDDALVWTALAVLWCVWNFLFVFPLKRFNEFKDNPQFESRKTASWIVSALIFCGALYSLLLDKSTFFVSAYVLSWIAGMGLLSAYYILTHDFRFKAPIKNKFKARI